MSGKPELKGRAARLARLLPTGPGQAARTPFVLTATGSDPAGETREYLLSDRGRVYTMLAHASGRLG